jgi:hypothetical protein
VLAPPSPQLATAAPRPPPAVAPPPGEFPGKLPAACAAAASADLAAAGPTCNSSAVLAPPSPAGNPERDGPPPGPMPCSPGAALAAPPRLPQRRLDNWSDVPSPAPAARADESKLGYRLAS